MNWKTIIYTLKAFAVLSLGIGYLCLAAFIAVGGLGQ